MLVVGGTGSLGQVIVARALERGHRVTLLARDPKRVQLRSPDLDVVEGDALLPPSIDSAVAGHDAVVNALGAGLVRRTTLFSDSTRILIDSLHRHGVRRLVAITGVGAGETKGHGGFLYDHVIYPVFNRGVYQDKDRQEALIRASDLDWTLVRPASFREKSTTTPIEVIVQVAGVSLCWISRREVSAFVVDELEHRQFVRQAVFIGHRC
jgi:putative NADH-flavin reductase